MKTLLYVFAIIFLSFNVVSCTPTTLTEDVKVESTVGEETSDPEDEEEDS